MIDTKALQLASRFALPPNSLGYCGKNTAPAKFISCVIDNESNDVEKELEKFIVLNPYLNTLSKITGLNKFSYKVVEAYWLGNSELKKAKPKDYNILLSNFRKQGVPSWFVDELEEKLPKEFIPMHLFQVLFVGVGRASGSVPYNMETINNCMIRWGKVKKIDKKKLTVNLNSLKKEGKAFSLTKRVSTFEYRFDFLKGLKVGSVVAVHWKQVVKVLTEKESERLEYWTKKILASLKNSSN